MTHVFYKHHFSVKERTLLFPLPCKVADIQCGNKWQTSQALEDQTGTCFCRYTLTLLSLLVQLQVNKAFSIKTTNFLLKPSNVQIDKNNRHYLLPLLCNVQITLDAQTSIPQQLELYLPVHLKIAYDLPIPLFSNSLKYT